MKEKDASYYKNAIPETFLTACKMLGYTDPANITQNNYNACLMFIAENIMTRQELKENNSNRYNMKLLSDIADIYIALCYRYNKIVSLYGFSLLCNIPIHNIEQWKCERVRNATPEVMDMLKKLETAAEASKRGLLTDKGKNPVGVLALLNHDNGYNVGYSRESASERALSISEIRQKIGLLSDNSAD